MPQDRDTRSYGWCPLGPVLQERLIKSLKPLAWVAAQGAVDVDAIKADADRVYGADSGSK